MLVIKVEDQERIRVQFRQKLLDEFASRLVAGVTPDGPVVDVAPELDVLKMSSALKFGIAVDPDGLAHLTFKVQDGSWWAMDWMMAVEVGAQMLAISRLTAFLTDVPFEVYVHRMNESGELAENRMRELARVVGIAVPDEEAE